MNRRALALLSVGHFLIDLCQGIVPALAPFLVEGRGFSKAEAAGLVFAISATSSIVQPIFGQLADRLAMNWLLPASLFLGGAALSLGAQAASYPVALLAFGLSGIGVAAFHPEAARKANLASGDRRTTGMSFFSIGGSIGFAAAPAVTKTLWEAHESAGLLMLLFPTLAIATLFLGRLGQGTSRSPAHHTTASEPAPKRGDDWLGFGILSVATVMRSIVFFGFNTFLALYFMGRWHLSASDASWASIVFLAASIPSNLLGGWMADRYGRREVMRIGFTVATVLMAAFLVTSDRMTAMVLLVPLSIFLFLSTSVLVVLGQEYLPDRVGLASGMTLGLAVSMGGMTTPLLGWLADRHGMPVVLMILLGMLALAAMHSFALPVVGRHRVATVPEPMVSATAES